MGWSFSQLFLTASLVPSYRSAPLGADLEHQPGDGGRLEWSSGALRSLTLCWSLYKVHWCILPAKMRSFACILYCSLSICTCALQNINLCFSFVNSVVWILQWSKGILDKWFILLTVFPSLAEFKVHALTRICALSWGHSLGINYNQINWTFPHSGNFLGMKMTTILTYDWVILVGVTCVQELQVCI